MFFGAKLQNTVSCQQLNTYYIDVRYPSQIGSNFHRNILNSHEYLGSTFDEFQS